MKIVVLLAVAGAAFALAPTTLAAVVTTKPGEHVIFGVRITDKRITVYPNSREARGVVATFTIDNKGKKPHSFVFLGHNTHAILPGRSAVFTVILVLRGRFLYRSALDTGSGFRGYFLVH